MKNNYIWKIKRMNMLKKIKPFIFYAILIAVVALIAFWVNQTWQPDKTTYTEFAEIVGLSKYSTTIYLSHFNFARFRIETRKGYDNMVKINEEFVAKMCEYLYLKRKFEAMKNLKSYYLDKLKDL